MECSASKSVYLLSIINIIIIFYKITLSKHMCQGW